MFNNHNKWSQLRWVVRWHLSRRLRLVQLIRILWPIRQLSIKQASHPDKIDWFAVYAIKSIDHQLVFDITRENDIEVNRPTGLDICSEVNSLISLHSCRRRDAQTDPITSSTMPREWMCLSNVGYLGSKKSFGQSSHETGVQDNRREKIQFLHWSVGFDQRNDIDPSSDLPQSVTRLNWED